MRQFKAGDIYQCRTDKNGGKNSKDTSKTKKRHQEWLNKTEINLSLNKKTRHQNANLV